MSKVSTTWSPYGVTIWCGDQHISRMTYEEMRELAASLYMFGGTRLRQELRNWIQEESNLSESYTVTNVAATH